MEKVTWTDFSTGETIIGTIIADKIKLPTTKTVNWNPEDYTISKIDTENGLIKFKKI